MPLRYVMPHVITSRNHVICNQSLRDYVQLIVTDNYDLFFKFGWIFVLLSTSCDYDLFHLSNRLIFHNVFVIFTTSYIHLIALSTKVVTLQLHKVCMLPSSYTYRLFNNTYVFICIYLLTKYLPTYLLPFTYLLCTYVHMATYYVFMYMQSPIMYLGTYHLHTTYIITKYLHTYIPTYPCHQVI